LAEPFRALADGLRLDLRVRPRARQSTLEGVVAGADGRPRLAVRIAAPPAEGAANQALIALIAERLDLPRGRIALSHGAGGRDKTLTIAGDPAALAERLKAMLNAG